MFSALPPALLDTSRPSLQFRVYVSSNDVNHFDCIYSEIAHIFLLLPHLIDHPLDSVACHICLCAARSHLLGDWILYFICAYYTYYIRCSSAKKKKHSIFQSHKRMSYIQWNWFNFILHVETSRPRNGRRHNRTLWWIFNEHTVSRVYGYL